MSRASGGRCADNRHLPAAQRLRQCLVNFLPMVTLVLLSFLFKWSLLWTQDPWIKNYQHLPSSSLVTRVSVLKELKRDMVYKASTWCKEPFCLQMFWQTPPASSQQTPSTPLSSSVQFPILPTPAMFGMESCLHSWFTALQDSPSLGNILYSLPVQVKANSPLLLCIIQTSMFVLVVLSRPIFI